MKLPLSSRLLACCGFVCPGERVADIGCDHGYLGIHLLQTGKASSVIAADINQMPLDSARKNALKYGVIDKMSFYLTDGVRGIPRDFDCLVCAGMGADTMISILEAAPWLRDSRYRLILQCQSKLPALRQYLSEQGFRICEETVLRDGRFLYTVMEVTWQSGYTLSPGEWYFPPALLENPSNLVPEYYQRVLFSLDRAVTNQKEKDQTMVLALEQLRSLSKQEELMWLQEDYNDNRQ